MTLYDITDKESGIVVYENDCAIMCNWANIEGLPQILPGGLGLIGFRENLPDKDNVEWKYGPYFHILEDKSLFDFSDSEEELPPKGDIWTFKVEGQTIIIITPEGWQ
jgi:hypothetical protein